jgi:hypothetical protein
MQMEELPYICMELTNNRVKEYGLDTTGSRGGPVTSYYSHDKAYFGSTKGGKVFECLANLHFFEDFFLCFCTVHCDTVMKNKSTKRTLFQLMF